MIRINNRRYIGSKTKLLNEIYQSVEENIAKKDYSFADIFAGTGVVAYYFAQKNHNVIVNDILYSNVIAYKAWLSKENINNEKLAKTINFLNTISADDLKNNYFSKIYANKYFSVADAKKIGFIRDYIEEHKSEFNEREQAILSASLIYAADKIANTVGHFEYFLKQTPTTHNIKLEELAIENNIASADIYNIDANELVKKINADVVYIDPPYNARQYVNFYHLLENLARWEKPTEFEGNSMKFKRNHLKSGYSRSFAPTLFKDLINSIKAELIVVSYNNTYTASSSASNNKITEDQLFDILSSKGEVIIKEIDYKSFNSGKTNFTGHKEKLYICKVGKGENRI